jgi:hypothetical protein
MLLIGFKTQNTGLGNTESSYASVTHQSTHIIAGSQSDTAEDLTKLYQKMVKKAQESRKALEKLNDELEFSNLSVEEYNKLENKYLKDISILKFDRVIVVEGFILK